MGDKLNKHPQQRDRKSRPEEEDKDSRIKKKS